MCVVLDNSKIYDLSTLPSYKCMNALIAKLQSSITYGLRYYEGKSGTPFSDMYDLCCPFQGLLGSYMTTSIIKQSGNYKVYKKQKTDKLLINGFIRN
eukprot:295836_1